MGNLLEWHTHTFNKIYFLTQFILPSLIMILGFTLIQTTFSENRSNNRLPHRHTPAELIAFRKACSKSSVSWPHHGMKSAFLVSSLVLSIKTGTITSPPKFSNYSSIQWMKCSAVGRTCWSRYQKGKSYFTHLTVLAYSRTIVFMLCYKPVHAIHLL